MLEYDWSSRKMFTFDSPEPDIFSSAGDQLVVLNWTELDGENVEVADLASQLNCTLLTFYLGDIKDRDDLPIVDVDSHHG